jgi:hypothetical protein
MPCEGVVMNVGAVGPAGSLGGNQCWLKSALLGENQSPGLEGNVTAVISATLNPPLTVFEPLFIFYL